MKIYLDVCCFSRPFDDQTPNQIAMETNAIHRILDECSSGSLTLVVSKFIHFEIRNTVDTDRKQSILGFLNWGNAQHIVIKDEMRIRANELQKCGYKSMDAAHIATAEIAGVDVFLTTDKKLLGKYERGLGDIKMTIDNPLFWLMRKDLEDENS